MTKKLMTSDIQTDIQTYILPLVVLSAALQQKTCMTSTLKELITDLAKNCVQIKLERITTNHISTMIIETKLDKSRNMFLPLKT